MINFSLRSTVFIRSLVLPRPSACAVLGFDCKGEVSPCHAYDLVPFTCNVGSFSGMVKVRPRVMTLCKAHQGKAVPPVHVEPFSEEERTVWEIMER